MKKVMLVVLFALLAIGLATAQAYVPTVDELGAHNNGGRGCAGCHAPHSGGRGSGGQTVTGSTVTPVAGLNQGDYHLWGTDMSLITQETLHVGGGYDNGGAGYVLNFGGGQEWTATTPPYVGLIASCLSCHDGNVSEGAMMKGQSYEQLAGLLPSGAGEYAYTGPLYGKAAIPTLLGNDGGAAGDYLNDHPVGPNANINGLAYPTAGPGLSVFGLTYTVNVNSAFSPITWTPSGEYASFLANYGAPAVNGMQVDSVNLTPYVTCTTCHNQHQMTVYSASGSGLGAIKGAAGTYETYFFVNAPYNPGAAWTPTLAPSTTQFCRQCHFGEANEYFGNTGIGTAF